MAVIESIINVHKENLYAKFIDATLEELNANEISTIEQAFNRVVAKWMGYEIDEGMFVDGAGDRGVDFWFASTSAFDIFQVKSHKLNDKGQLSEELFGHSGVSDLDRIKRFLINGDGIKINNKKLKDFRQRWEHVLNSRRLSDHELKPIIVNLNLVVIGNGLTDAALDEFNSFSDSIKDPLVIDDVAVQFYVNLLTIRDIITEKWRQDNREWVNIEGLKKNWIELHPEQGEWLKGVNSAVFYCPAIDLVNGYKEFGYQIFEPNVRCNIVRSKVNLSIQESIKHQSSRKEFKFLNNGVTITCTSFSKPSQNRSSFKVMDPGIVNGLQTVVSITEAYDGLSKDDKKDFAQKCYILVRLLRENVVRDISKVVQATNTQNEMQARNLLSNTPEQIYYEKLFAEIGWFYERKQGAWSAFESNPSRWRTLNNKRKSNFTVIPTDKRTKVRKVDNEEIAQTWISFIGFSDIAVQEKSKLFDNRNYYELCFLQRTYKHGADIDNKISNAKDFSESLAPSENLLFASYLTRQFARNVIHSQKDLKVLTCKRLNLDTSKLSNEQVNTELFKDNDYLLGLALSGMSFLFVEFLGFMIYRALGDDIHNYGPRLLNNKTFKYLKETFDTKSLKALVDEERFESDDILCVSWFIFKYVVDELMSGGWKDTYLSAQNKSRFLSHKDTRQRIIRAVENLHKYTVRNGLARTWAIGIKPNQGIYGYIKDILTSSQI